jgi:hypothetical protein
MNGADFDKMLAAIQRLDEICRETEAIRQDLENLASAPPYFPDRSVTLPSERASEGDPLPGRSRSPWQVAHHAADESTFPLNRARSDRTTGVPNKPVPETTGMSDCTDTSWVSK